MATTDLTAARLRATLDYDELTGVFLNRFTRNNNGAPIGGKAGTISHYGYIEICIEGVLYKAHRLAWLYVTGQWPLQLIDHINRIKADNRFKNLREVSSSTNVQNTLSARKNNSTGYLGVIPHGNGFRAQIMKSGRTTSLGTFKTPELAHAAYLVAKKLYHPGAILEPLDSA